MNKKSHVSSESKSHVTNVTVYDVDECEALSFISCSRNTDEYDALSFIVQMFKHKIHMLRQRYLSSKTEEARIMIYTAMLREINADYLYIAKNRPAWYPVSASILLKIFEFESLYEQGKYDGLLSENVSNNFIKEMKSVKKNISEYLITTRKSDLYRKLPEKILDYLKKYNLKKNKM